MTGSYDISTLILAAAAALVVWWLYSVLGTRNGGERPPPFDPFQSPPPDTNAPAPFGRESNVLRMPVPANDATPVEPVIDPDRWKGVIEEGSAAAVGLDAIMEADHAFSGTSFLSGARSA